MGAKKFSFGILGGGQLARMLVESASRHDVVPLVYVSDANDPAAQVTKNYQLGLEKFLDRIETVLFESEIVSDEVLAFIKLKNLKSHPSIEIMERLRNKYAQKELMSHLKIPTTKYILIDRRKSAEENVIELEDRFPSGFVLKTAYGGYDGKGVFFSGTSSSQELEKIISNFISKKISLYAEEKIDFESEIALVSTRSIDGSFSTFPLFKTVQENGICRYVVAKEKGIDFELNQKAKHIAKTISEDLDYHGVFAVEFLFSKKRGLLVN